MGLKPGQKVKYTIVHGRLIVEKVITIDEVLSKEPKVHVSF